MTLAEFVGMCNICTKDVVETTSSLDLAAKTLYKGLANGFINPTDYKTGIDLCDDNSFFDSLKRRGYTKNSTEYRFLQDENVVAKIRPFPQIENVDSIRKIESLSQKWHVLFSLLAYLDTASFDEDVNMCDTFKIGKISNIILDEKNKVFEIHTKDEIKKYGPRQSRMMNKWIFECVAKCKNDKEN